MKSSCSLRVLKSKLNAVPFRCLSGNFFNLFRLKYLLAILVGIITLSSCGEKDTPPPPAPPVFQAEKTTLSINGASGDKDSLTLQSGVNWTATVSPATTTWLTMSHTSGSGNQKIIVSANDDNITGAVRTATLTITPSGNTAVQPIIVTVTQNPQALFVKTDSASLSLGAAVGAVDSFAIQSNTEWTLSVAPASATWFKVNVSTGQGNGKVIVTTLVANFGGQPRSASIVVTATNPAARPPLNTYALKIEQKPSSEWLMTFGGANRDELTSIVRTTDGYILGGMTESVDGDFGVNHGGRDALLIKVKDNGTVEWQKTYGGSLNDMIFGLVVTPDGGCLFTGSTASNNGQISGSNGGLDLWVGKVDATGNLQWQKPFGTSNDEMGNSIVATSDGNYIMGGYININYSTDFYAVKMDASGNKLWEKSYALPVATPGDKTLETGYTVAASPDGGCIIGGTYLARSYTGPNGIIVHDDVLLIKLDASGNEQWTKTFGGLGADGARAIIPTADGNYMVTGYTNCSSPFITSDNGPADLFVAQIDKDGNQIWFKTYGGSNSDGGLAITKDNSGYIISGLSKSMDGDVTKNEGQFDMWLLKVNESGSKVWQRSVGGTQNDFAYGVTVAGDGSVVAVGYSEGEIKDVQPGVVKDGILIRIKP